MRIGLVSPYSFDVPGGVQLHVRDLAQFLMADGHDVSVLAPADDTSTLPPFVVSAGRAVPIRYNGSVARLAFGPRANARTNRWIEQRRFDVLHVHEPMTPSVSLLALRAYEGPIVATFHTATERSRAMLAANPLLRPALERISGRIAVSQDARRTVTSHLGGDAVIIPNGVYVEAFANASVRPEWAGTRERPTLAFLGRMNEPRKGLHVLTGAIENIAREHPGVRVLVAGPGSVDDALASVTPAAREHLEFLGAISDEDKARLFRSVDAYIAPNTGGESFGIILVEAMAAGAPVVASDLEAFQNVLGSTGPRALFTNGDSADLARAVSALLANHELRDTMSRTERLRAEQFDWSTVARRIVGVYETVIEAHQKSRQPWSLWR